MGVPTDTVYDPDDTYELTADNAKKILAVYMRLRYLWSEGCVEGGWLGVPDVPYKHITICCNGYAISVIIKLIVAVKRKKKKKIFCHWLCLQLSYHHCQMSKNFLLSVCRLTL
jgi:hypothetical protein